MPEGLMQSIERCCVQALAVGEARQSARSAAQDRPTNIELAFYIFLMLVGRTPYLTYKIDSRPTFCGVTGISS